MLTREPHRGWLTKKLDRVVEVLEEMHNAHIAGPRGQDLGRLAGDARLVAEVLERQRAPTDAAEEDDDAAAAEDYAGEDR